MARLSYYVDISNSYLGKHKRVTGRTPREVEAKATEQLLRWAQEEERARERAAVADEKERANQDTEEALARIEEYRGILKATLAVDDRIRWEDSRTTIHTQNHSRSSRRSWLVQRCPIGDRCSRR
jgi:restriction system protein